LKPAEWLTVTGPGEPRMSKYRIAFLIWLTVVTVVAARIATRYEKTAPSFASMLFVVAAMIWIR
jgi:hypothetical protein